MPAAQENNFQCYYQIKKAIILNRLLLDHLHHSHCLLQYHFCLHIKLNMAESTNQQQCDVLATVQLVPCEEGNYVHASNILY